MSAAVVADVDDQRVAVELGQIAAVELGEPPRSHVGDVDVADAAAGAVVHQRAVRLHPCAVAQHAFVAQRAYQHAARRAAGAPHDGEHDVAPGLVHEQCARPGLGGYRVSADPDDEIAFLHVDAGLRKRRVGVAVPRVSAQNALDTIRTQRVVPNDVRAKEAALVLRRDRLVAAGLVRMRGAELALHLPDHVGELVARAYLRKQCFVARQDGVPVDPRHLGVPEVLALQAPGFAHHLQPLSTRFDQHADSAEVEPAGAPSDLLPRLVVGIVFRKIGARVDRAQLAVRKVDQRARVRSEHEVVDLGRERRTALLFEIIREELAFGFFVIAVARPDPAHRKAREDGAPLRRRDAVVRTLVDRERQHAERHTLRLDDDRRLDVALVVRLVVVVVTVFVQRRGLGDERVRERLAQGHQIRAPRLGEAELELQRVVHRMKVARREEVEVVALRIPGRRTVLAQRARRVDDAAALALGDAHDRRMRLRRPHVREPAPVRRKRKVVDAFADAQIEQPRLASEVEQPQLVAVVREREPVAGR